jgi:hypothetical protein
VSDSLKRSPAIAAASAVIITSLLSMTANMGSGSRLRLVGGMTCRLLGTLGWVTGSTAWPPEAVPVTLTLHCRRRPPGRSLQTARGGSYVSADEQV